MKFKNRECSGSLFRPFLAVPDRAIKGSGHNGITHVKTGSNKRSTKATKVRREKKETKYDLQKWRRDDKNQGGRNGELDDNEKAVKTIST